MLSTEFFSYPIVWVLIVLSILGAAFQCFGGENWVIRWVRNFFRSAAFATAVLFALTQVADVCGKWPGLCGMPEPSPQPQIIQASIPAPVERTRERIIERVIVKQADSTVEVVAPAPKVKDQPRPAATQLTKAPERKVDETKVASAPQASAAVVHGWSKVATPAPGAPAGRADKGREDKLISDIKVELNRLNCFKGTADTLWGRDAVQAVNRFNAYGYRRLVDFPDEELLSILREFGRPVCP